MRGFEAVFGALFAALFLFAMLGYQIWTERKKAHRKRNNVRYDT